MTTEATARALAMAILPNFSTFAEKASVELDATVAMAEAVGFSAPDAASIVTRMRRVTPWDFGRIRWELATNTHNMLAKWLPDSASKEGS